MQEAWLAGLHGDQDLGFNASSPFGAINAMGNSKQKTDIHSLVAKTANVDRDIAKVLNYGCVPLSAEALTKDGWKKYDELNVGDFILAYDSETETNKWAPIEVLAYYDDAPLVKTSHSHNYEHLSTPNHRWYVKERSTNKANRKEMVAKVRTTETLTKESNIITSAMSEGGNSPITPDEAAIISWLITDGGVYWADDTKKTSSSFGAKRSVSASVFQKKPMQVDLLTSLLSPYLVNIYKRLDAYDEVMYTFYLKPQFVRELWAKAGLEPEKENYVALVTELSVEAREAFLEAFWLAEGHTDSSGVKHISQNNGSELEAVLVAANMCGYQTRQSYKDRERKCQDVRLSERQHVTGQRLVFEDNGNAPVWCPKTKYGTWVMRQGHTITITGNTLYGAGLKGNMDVLMKSEPSLEPSEAKAKTQTFMNYLKGEKDWNNGGYSNGIASLSFTQMETIADRKQPRTPLTGAYMSRALAGIEDYKPSRVNWVVQSSGVDFRDMLVLLTNYFYKKTGVNGRLVLTIHDEVRTMVKDEDIAKATYCLQLAHLYTRTAFLVAHKLDNIPAGCAWFSAVDVDNICLRKDPSKDQQTPTQAPLPLGYALTAKQLQELL